MYVGDCQNYGPFLGPYYNTGPNTGPNLGDPKRDHNFDNPPCISCNPSKVYRFTFMLCTPSNFYQSHSIPLIPVLNTPPSGTFMHNIGREGGIFDVRGGGESCCSTLVSPKPKTDYHLRLALNPKP